MAKIYTALFCLLLAAFAANAAAEEVPSDDYFLHLYNEKEKLKDAGAEIDIADTADVFGNLSGGTRRGADMLNNFVINASLDGDKLLNAKGLTATLTLFNNDGGRPDHHLTGAVERIDNLETYHNGFDVYQAWLQQNFLADKLSFLAGIYDLSNEFYTTDSSNLFINYAFGLGPEFASLAKKGPAIFPTSSPAFRMRLQPIKSWYLQASISDGINGAPETVRYPGIQLNGSAGALAIAETGYVRMHEKEEIEKYAMGLWRYTQERRNILENDNLDEYGISDGVYFLGERTIMTDWKERYLKAFMKFGLADDKASTFDRSWSAGLIYSYGGEARKEWGLAISQAHTSSLFSLEAESEGIATNNKESLIELTYKDQIEPWLSIQPDLQYIFNPGIDRQDDALVIGSRVTIAF